MKKGFSSVDEYILEFPENVQSILTQLRKTILENAPGSTEGFNYGMPAYKIFGKPLVYFAGYKNHIGFYALPSGHKKFEKELSQYKQGKGSVQFPIGKPVPFNLIAKIVIFRAEENKTSAKSQK